MSGFLERIPALVVSLAAIAATLSPAFGDPPRDSFPLSTYPMFSSVRETSSIDVVVGFDEEGRAHRIPPSAVANAEVMQAAQTIALAVRQRRGRALCAEVAARVAENPELALVRRLEVQSRRFDPRTYFVDADGKEPIRLRVRAWCEVPR